MTRQRLLGGAAVIFGVMTLVTGGAALLGTTDMGAVVPFVLWFNTFAGIAYVLAGILIWTGHRLALLVAVTLFAASAIVLLLLGWWVMSGHPFERRTLAAMTLRTGFWAGMAWLLARAGRTA